MKANATKLELVLPLWSNREWGFIVIRFVLTIVFATNYCISCFSDLTWLDRFMTRGDFSGNKCSQALTVSHARQLRHPADCRASPEERLFFRFVRMVRWRRRWLKRFGIFRAWDIGTYLLSFISCTRWHSWARTLVAVRRTEQWESHCIVPLLCEVSTFLPSCQSVPLNTTHPYPSALTGRARSGSRRSPNPPQCLPDALAQGFPLSLHTKRPRSATFYFALLPDKSFCLLVHLLAFWPLSPHQEADSCRYAGPPQ